MDETIQSEFSAFKKEEKKYKLHKTQVLKYSKGKMRGQEWVVRSTDLSEVVDVRNTAKEWPGVRRAGPIDPQNEASKRQKAYCFDEHPGALTDDEQTELAQQALNEFPNPPAVTNLTAEFGNLPNLYAAAAQNLHLDRVNQVANSYSAPPPRDILPGLAADRHKLGCSPNSFQEVEDKKIPEGGCRISHCNDFQIEDRESPIVADHENTREYSPCRQGNIWTSNPQWISACKLLERLRWAALGPHYDWSERQYVTSRRFMELPAKLRLLGTACAKLTGIDFEPDAALVNYYGRGHTIGGHVDDAEFDMRHPIVSLSLGCPAVFLMGGETKDVVPTPILLQSGDVVVLGGHARKCYHGVPRVLTASDHPSKGAGSQTPGRCPEVLQRLPAYLCDRRINISIRRVLRESEARA